MTFHKTKIEGLYILEPELKVDERGSFMRIFCKEELAKIGANFNIVQANRSMTLKKGTIRGMHFQKNPREESKIVCCISGAIYDVALDLRRHSPTYGHWETVKLTKTNHKMFLLPKGCAHGFQTLTNNCQILYFMSEKYSKEHSSGIRWNDDAFNIQWPILNPTLSKKDKNWILTKT